MNLATPSRFGSFAFTATDRACETVGQDWVVRVYFPNMDEVFLSGEFNRWSIPGIVMEQVAAFTWEARLTLSDLSAMGGCFGFVRGRMQQVRYLLLGQPLSSIWTPGTRQFQVLHHGMA